MAGNQPVPDDLVPPARATTDVLEITTRPGVLGSAPPYDPVGQSGGSFTPASPPHGEWRPWRSTKWLLLPALLVLLLAALAIVNAPDTELIDSAADAQEAELEAADDLSGAGSAGSAATDPLADTTTTTDPTTSSESSTPVTTPAETASTSTTSATPPPETAATAAQTSAAQTSAAVTTAAPTVTAAASTTTAAARSACDPNYSGCVPIASDVDCAGGSGDGPEYVSGPVQVIGSDIYDLDRDGDGTGCE
jgi:hypothetical protein